MIALARSNFRGARACVILAQDQNRDILVRTLERLGLNVTLRDPLDDASDAGPCDIVFVDADQDFSVLEPEIPHIALIGMEAPSRLSRVVRHRAAAILMKPVRATGVFTAIFLAFNEHATRQRELHERQQLLRRAEGRRSVVKAILQLMKERNLSDDDAYQELRRASMAKRVTIEEFAAEIVAASTSSMRLAGKAAHERTSKQP